MIYQWLYLYLDIHENILWLSQMKWVKKYIVLVLNILFFTGFIYVFYISIDCNKKKYSYPIEFKHIFDHVA